MKVDDDVEALLPEGPGELQVVGEPRPSARTVDDHHTGEVRVVPNDRLGRALDEVGERGVRESLL